MNALAPSSKPLRTQTSCDLRRPLFKLFAGYDQPYVKGDPEKLMAAKVEVYLLATAGLPEWAVDDAVTDFIQGRVDRKNRDRLPTAEQISALAREHLQKEVSAQNRRRETLESIQETRQHLEKEAWLNSPEGQAHLKQRQRQVKDILARAFPKTDGEDHL